jgi:iron(III) transport system substrate-binding protein
MISRLLQMRPAGDGSCARSLGAALLAALAMAGCRASSCDVVAYTSVDQVFSDPVFRQFEAKSKLRVCAVFDTEETKSTGVLNRLIAEADRPQADVFWSGDPIRPFVLIGRGLVEPYHSPAATAVPAPFRAEDGAWAGVAARARVLLVNTQRLGDRLAPVSIRDLADARFRNDAAIASPLFGTTTVHVAALASRWGEEETRRFLARLSENGVRVASSNGEVRRLVEAGEVAIGLTDTDDAHEAKTSGAPVVIVYPDQEPGGLGAFVMPTTVVRIRGGPHPDVARQLVDHLLSASAERYLAAHGAHMPLRSGVATPRDVRSVHEIRAMDVDYRVIAEVLERIQPWLRDWVGV